MALKKLTDEAERVILAEMDEAGFWAKPGPGYNPKYRGTVWSLITLAQLGAHVSCDERIGQGCSYVMDHSFREGGRFTMRGTPSSAIDCLQGNLCAAFCDLGFDDPRLEEAYEWMARSVTGEGVPCSSKDGTTCRSASCPRRAYTTSGWRRERCCPGTGSIAPRLPRLTRTCGSSLRMN